MQEWVNTGQLPVTTMVAEAGGTEWMQIARREAIVAGVCRQCLNPQLRRKHTCQEDQRDTRRQQMAEGKQMAKGPQMATARVSQLAAGRSGRPDPGPVPVDPTAAKSLAPPSTKRAPTVRSGCLHCGRLAEGRACISCTSCLQCAQPTRRVRPTPHPRPAAHPPRTS